LKIAALRVFDRTTIKLSVSIQKSVLKEIDSEQDLESKLIEESKKQTEFANQELNEEKIKELLKAELDALKAISANKDFDAMIKKMPGKSLIAKLFPLTGAQNIHDYARACAKHVKIDDVDELMTLRSQLLS
jgi:hypothetical protein